MLTRTLCVAAVVFAIGSSGAQAQTASDRDTCLQNLKVVQDMTTAGDLPTLNEKEAAWVKAQIAEAQANCEKGDYAAAEKNIIQARVTLTSE